MHDVGYAESGLICSCEPIAIADEIIDTVRGLGRGIGIKPETLPLDTIDRVGPLGHFLGRAHRACHCR